MFPGISFVKYNEKNYCVNILKRICKGEDFSFRLQKGHYTPVLVSDLKKSQWIVYKVKSLLTPQSLKAYYVARLVETNQELLFARHVSDDFNDLDSNIKLLRDIKIVFPSVSDRLKPLRKRVKALRNNIIQEGTEILQKIKDEKTRITKYTISLETKKVLDEAKITKIEQRKDKKVAPTHKMPTVNVCIGEDYYTNSKNHDLVIEASDGSTITTHSQHFTAPEIKKLIDRAQEVVCVDGTKKKRIKLNASLEAIKICLEFLYKLKPSVTVTKEVFIEVLALAKMLNDQEMIKWARCVLREVLNSFSLARKFCSQKFLRSCSDEIEPELLLASVSTLIHKYNDFKEVREDTLLELEDFAIASLISNKDINLGYNTENELFDFVIRWAKNKINRPELSKEELKPLIKEVLMKKTIFNITSIADHIQFDKLPEEARYYMSQPSLQVKALPTNTTWVKNEVKDNSVKIRFHTDGINNNPVKGTLMTPMGVLTLSITKTQSNGYHMYEDTYQVTLDTSSEIPVNVNIKVEDISKGNTLVDNSLIAGTTSNLVIQKNYPVNIFNFTKSVLDKQAFRGSVAIKISTF
jgi:hypothetical protein